MIKTVEAIPDKNWAVIYDGKSVLIVFPVSDDPNSPIAVRVDKKCCLIDVIEDGEVRTKKIEWRDGLIMNKALAQIINGY